MGSRCLFTAFLSLLILAMFQPAVMLFSQQKMDSIQRAQSEQILRDAYDNVKKHYYDSKYHGLDLDARYHDFDARVKNAPNLGQAFRMVAAFLDGLNDSHTFFEPPSRTSRTEDGYQLRIYGDNCFVVAVRPGTDAEAKVHIGDQVLTYNNYNVNRADKWKMEYYFKALAPQPASVLELRDPAGQERKVTVDAKVRELKKVMDLTGANSGGDMWDLVREEENSNRIMRQRWVNVSDVMIWKMPIFFLEDTEVDHIFAEARKHRALIIDLRGNPGGAVVTLERIISDMFEGEVKVADRIGRKDLKPEIAKAHGGDKFTGKVIVILDSGSASAAELLARVIQLEKRGTVIGDRSSGAVMESLRYPASQGVDTKIF
jgi:C-terminal processing protease CtpA/Prc